MYRKLYEAATWGNEDLLMDILATDEQLLYSEAPHEQTALHIAARLGHAMFVSKMLEVCNLPLLMKLNSDEDTLLHCAARSGRLEVIEVVVDLLKTSSEDVELGEGRLLRKRNKQGNTALHEAVMRGHGDVAIKLVQFDPTFSFIINNAEESPLHLAAKAELPLVVDEILSLTNDAEEQRRHLIRMQDITGRTALHYAAGRNNDKIVEMLLRNDPSVAYIPEHDGYSPLHIAAASGCSKAIATLLDHCPDAIEQHDQRGRNALHISIINYKKLDGWQKQLQDTIINEPDHDGNTPLHLAAKLVRTRVVWWLLKKKGVDMNAKNKDGLTALDLAMSQRKSLPVRAVVIATVSRRYGAVMGHPWRTPKASDEILPTARDIKGKVDTEMTKDVTAIYMVAVALVAAVTFAAAFTMPGGYKNDGTPALANSAAFKAFLISNTISMCSSLAAGVCFITETNSRVFGRVWNVDVWGFQLVFISFATLLISFMTAIFAVVASQCMWLAIVICFICAAPCALNLTLFICEVIDMTPTICFFGKIFSSISRNTKHCNVY